MKKAIIFDNDGVLVDTEPLYFQATQEMCARNGKELNLEKFVECHIKNSHGTRSFLELPEDEYATQRSWRNDRYAALLAQGNHTCPGVEEVIHQLAQQFRLCIVTSSRRSHFNVIHRHSPYIKHFEFVVALEDVSESKPSPEPYLTALDRLELSASDCIVIEDSERGLRSAQAADVECIIVRSALSKFMNLQQPFRMIDTIRDLPKLLQNASSIHESL